MINLLADTVKKEIRKERVARFLTVLAGFSILSVWIVIGSSMPTLFESYTGYSVLGLRYSTLNENETDTNSELTKEFNDFSANLNKLIPSEKPQASLNDILKVILVTKVSSIKINSFSLVADDPSNRKLVLTGVAQNRENLLSFAKKFEENNLFENVDLPVSNFSQKNDIDFVLTLTLAQP